MHRKQIYRCTCVILVSVSCVITHTTPTCVCVCLSFSFALMFIFSFFVLLSLSRAYLIHQPRRNSELLLHTLPRNVPRTHFLLHGRLLLHPPFSIFSFLLNVAHVALRRFVSHRLAPNNPRCRHHLLSSLSLCVCVRLYFRLTRTQYSFKDNTTTIQLPQYSSLSLFLSLSLSLSASLSSFRFHLGALCDIYLRRGREMMMCVRE